MKHRLLVVVYPKTGGCQYFRQVHPHEGLEGTGDFEIVYKNIFEFLPNEEFKKYHLVHFHKNFVTPEILIKLKVLGIKTMVDFDDYWHLPTDHFSFRQYKENGQPQRFLEIIKQAGHISTTTALLAGELKKHNPNIHVLPNCLGNGCSMACPIEVKSGKLRFGYLGGSCHLPDVGLLRGINNKLSNSGLEYSLNLFGYKSAGAYFDYAKVLTGNGDHTDNLTLYPPLPVPDYLYFYNMVDVSLVPLVPNKFNSLKSELKLVEAGMFKHPVIASNVRPYQPFLRHKGNSFVANSKSDWFKGFRYFIKNPNAVSDCGGQLYRDIQKHFNYEKITAERAEIYRHIIQKG